MIKQVKLQLTLLLIIAGLKAPAQTIDSFHVNRLVNPHELLCGCTSLIPVII
ncbi:hypothetical protein D3C72_390270 [compost metagenome]